MTKRDHSDTEMLPVRTLPYALHYQTDRIVKPWPERHGPSHHSIAHHGSSSILFQGRIVHLLPDLVKNGIFAIRTRHEFSTCRTT
jgi:hypothetical protein